MYAPAPIDQEHSCRALTHASACRFFSLNDGELKYYASKEDYDTRQKPKGHISCRGMRAEAVGVSEVCAREHVCFAVRRQYQELLRVVASLVYAACIEYSFLPLALGYGTRPDISSQYM
jgi:hypothetical protein